MTNLYFVLIASGSHFLNALPTVEVRPVHLYHCLLLWVFDRPVPKDLLFAKGKIRYACFNQENFRSFWGTLLNFSMCRIQNTRAPFKNLIYIYIYISDQSDTDANTSTCEVAFPLPIFRYMHKFHELLYILHFYYSLSLVFNEVKYILFLCTTEFERNISR